MTARAVRRAGLLAYASSAVAAIACSSSTGGNGPGAGADAGSQDAPLSGDAAPLSGWEMGEATYYAATGAGACSFDATPNDLMVAAMDEPEYANSAVCGECVSIVGPDSADGATLTVTIVDECPGCGVGHLDLSQQAFSKIAPVSAGLVPIKWRVVPCAVTGPVAYRFKEGSSQYWTAIQVRNSRYAIQSLEWKAGGGSYAAVPRQSYNYFVLTSGVGTTGPFMVRVTASNGEVLEDTLSGVVAATVVEGAAQFP